MKQYTTVRAPVNDLTDQINQIIESLTTRRHRNPRLFRILPPHGTGLYSAVIEYEE